MRISIIMVESKSRETIMNSDSTDLNSKAGKWGRGVGGGVFTDSGQMFTRARVRLMG